jgi:hypothetical protein
MIYEPVTPSDLPVPERRGSWTVWSTPALTQYEARLFFWLEFGREPDRMIYDQFQGQGNWWMGWVGNEDMLRRSLPRENTTNLHYTRSLPPRGGKERVTYATVESTDGKTTTIAIWHNVTLVNPLEGEPYVDFHNAFVIGREMHEGDLDFLEAAKRWSICYYPAFDWPHHLQEFIRPQTFILQV